MTAFKLLSYVFGAVGVLASFMIYRQKDRKGLLIAKLISDIAWCAHYVLLLAFSGAVTCAISICREIVFLNRGHKWAENKIWLAVFVLCNAAAIALTWNGIYSILPGCSAIVSIIVYLIGDPHITRCVQIPISLAFLVYNTAVGSLFGILNETLSLISIFTFGITNYKKTH